MIEHGAKNVEKLGELEFGISVTGPDVDFRCDVEVEVESLRGPIVPMTGERIFPTVRTTP